MVDRVAYDWTLPRVAEGPLWSQFPRRCFATNKLFNGYTKKWILVPTSHNNRTVQYLTSHNIQGEHIKEMLKNATLRCYGFSHYRFGAKSIKLLRDKLNTYRSTDHRHTMYETISGYLVDATPEEFSKTFQHSVECLESCPLHAPEPEEHAARRRGPRPERAGGGGIHAALPVAALNRVYYAPRGRCWRGTRTGPRRRTSGLPSQAY